MLHWYWLAAQTVLSLLAVGFAIRRERARFPRSVFFVRHQAAGVVHQFAFLREPTDAQVAQVVAYCRSVGHAEGHPKSPDEPYWTRVVESPLLPQSAVAWEPAAPNQARSLAQFGSHGVGRIMNGYPSPNPVQK